MKVTKYLISYRENATNRRRFFAKEFSTKNEAKVYIKKLTAKGKINSYGVRGTAFRDTLNYGANNPRIKKVVVNRGGK